MLYKVDTDCILPRVSKYVFVSDDSVLRYVADFKALARAAFFAGVELHDERGPSESLAKHSEVEASEVIKN